MGELHYLTGSQSLREGRESFLVERTLELPINLGSHYQFQVIQEHLLLLLLSGENPNSIASPSRHFIKWPLLCLHLHRTYSSLLLKVGDTEHIDITLELTNNAELQGSLLTYKIRTCILTRTPGDLCAYWSFRSTALATVKDLVIL